MQAQSLRNDRYDCHNRPLKHPSSLEFIGWRDYDKREMDPTCEGCRHQALWPQPLISK